MGLIALKYKTKVGKNDCGSFMLHICTINCCKIMEWALNLSSCFLNEQIMPLALQQKQGIASTNILNQHFSETLVLKF